MLRDRDGWSLAWRDCEIKSNATSISMTIDDGISMRRDALRHPAAVSDYSHKPFLVDSINHRHVLVDSILVSSNQINGLRYENRSKTL